MNLITVPFTVLLTIFFLVYLLKKRPLTQIQISLFYVFICLLILSSGVLIQSVCYYFFNVDPIYFENFIYIGTCFLPVAIFFTVLIFIYTKITFKKHYLLVLIIPIISVLMVWTNNLHHLFYKQYSFNLSQMEFGSYFYVYTIYTYGLLFISIIMLINHTIKTSGFFSKQSILFIIGTLVPIISNLLGFVGIIDISVYVTPITFTISIIIYTLAILKFDFLTISPIALQRIVDCISDSYIVLNENNIIIDFNETFLNTFHLKSTSIRNISLIQESSEDSINIDNLIIILNKVKSSESFHCEKKFDSVNKYFNIEINDIKSKNNFIGILILFKDITQHIEDMNTIKANQDMLMEKERLASLGQLIGGIAHNLKTPIMSISGASEGLTDLVKEYDSSIGDSDVTDADHHEIANDMNEWIEKIKTHTAYMSDVITAVKGQAVTLSDEEQSTFSLEELVKRVNILMKHELKNALIDLNVSMNTNASIELHGNVNSLVQVINNMVSNAIQSYNGETNKSIDMIVSKENNNIVISIKDYGCGMTKEVKDKLFKEMITTKGKNGTGLRIIYVLFYYSCSF